MIFLESLTNLMILFGVKLKYLIQFFDNMLFLQKYFPI